MTKKKIILTSLLLLSLPIFSFKIKDFVSLSKPKPTFSIFIHPSKLGFSSFLDRLSDRKGYLNILGDGVFTYGLWDLKLDPEVDKSHFFKNEVDRKVFVSINLKDLLLLEVQELEKENRRTFSGLDYMRFKSLISLQEKLTWVLEDEVLLKDFCEQIKASCQYASRRDVFIFHGEYLLDPNLHEEAQVEIKALSKFLRFSSKKQEFLFDESLTSSMYSSDFQYKVDAWRAISNEDLETLFLKKLGSYQAKLGY